MASKLRSFIRAGLSAAGAAALLAALPTPAAHADTYVFERGHTALLFSWNHLGLSRQTARFTDYEGALELDTANPEKSHIEVLVKAASLATGFDALDRQLKTADYFNVATHPAITFASTAVKRTGNKTAEVTGQPGEMAMGGKAKHREENLSDHPFEVVVVEFKR